MQCKERHGSPPGFAHFVSLRQPPRRGQHQRPGQAGSAKACCSPPGSAHFVSLRQPPLRGQHLRPGKAGSAKACCSPPGSAHFVSLRQPPLRGQHLRPGKAGSAVFLEKSGFMPKAASMCRRPECSSRPRC
ncbi:hypothetical protein EJI01_25285 [Variovorax sp. MHTC-1]|nr:hypothetical protein EJI01_25285 [Variovorax sp. MHTC-1]